MWQHAGFAISSFFALSGSVRLNLLTYRKVEPWFHTWRIVLMCVPWSLSIQFITIPLMHWSVWHFQLFQMHDGNCRDLWYGDRHTLIPIKDHASEMEPELVCLQMYQANCNKPEFCGVCGFSGNYGFFTPGCFTPWLIRPWLIHLLAKIYKLNLC